MAPEAAKKRASAVATNVGSLAKDAIGVPTAESASGMIRPRRSRLSVTVLGSSGPIADAKRVSAGYLVSVDGIPRILVDAGGGVFERIGQGGLDISALEQILLTHMHIDHTSDLPAAIMHLYMLERKRPIAITGPAGRAGTGPATEINAMCRTEISTRNRPWSAVPRSKAAPKAYCYPILCRPSKTNLMRPSKSFGVSTADE
jgi:ribonuclease BN (tRNA processing enzyme)